MVLKNANRARRCANPRARPQRNVGAVLNAVSRRLALADANGTDEAIRESLAWIGEFVGIDRACLIKFSDDRQTFTMTHEWHSVEIHSQLDYFVNLPLSTFPWTAHQLLQGHPVPIDALDAYPPEAEMERQICLVEKNLSIVFVPTTVRGVVTGATAMDAIREPHAWTEDDMALLSVAGNLMATHLECRRVDERMESVSRLEREKLGRDLHDSLGQQLFGIAMFAGALRKSLADRHRRLAEQAQQIDQLARGVVQTARDMVKGLRPFDVKEEGLKAALRRMARETTQMLSVRCEFEDEDTPAVRDPEACTQLFWIAREATNNAIRHGHASRVTISMGLQDGRQQLTIRDDGAGLPADWESKIGVGLKVMRFRAAVMGGQVSIEPGAAGGTVVSCVFPVCAG